MIDKEKRIVIYGDKDVKMAATSVGIIFGDASVPDNEENIESSYIFGIRLSMPGIIEFDKELCKPLNSNDKELKLVAGNVTIYFKSKEDLIDFRVNVMEWANSLIYDAYKLLEYVQEVMGDKVEDEK